MNATKTGMVVLFVLSLLVGVWGVTDMNATSQYGRNALWLNNGTFSSITDDPVQATFQRNGLRYEEEMKKQGTVKLFVSALLFAGGIGALVKTKKQRSEDSSTQ